LRIVLVGRAADRARLRDELSEHDIEIVAEAATVAAARDGGFDADAFLVARPAGDDGEDDGTAPAFEEPLTPREIEVLSLVAEGLSNKSIALRLGISDQTVKFHVAAVIAKLGAANRTDAVRRGLRRGLVVI
jgi:DNA-binding NarL/FixJ family response regulator